MPLPKKLLEQGVRDMVRICDGRMSGTAYGTVVLHVAPEAAAGGPLAVVETGDYVVLDVPNRILDLDVDPGELSRRVPNRATDRWFRYAETRLGAAVHRPCHPGRQRCRPRLPPRIQRRPGVARVALSRHSDAKVIGYRPWRRISEKRNRPDEPGAVGLVGGDGERAAPDVGVVVSDCRGPLRRGLSMTSGSDSVVGDVHGDLIEVDDQLDVELGGMRRLWPHS